MFRKKKFAIRVFSSSMAIECHCQNPRKNNVVKQRNLKQNKKEKKENNR